MAENTIIRSRYKYKPDNSDKYVTIHFETNADIVQTPDLSEFGITKGASVTDVIKYLINDLIKTRALVPVCNTHSWFVLNNPVLSNGQMGYETDTCKTKMGDGINPYNMIKYTTGSGSDNSDDGIIMEVITDRKQFLDSTNPIIPLNVYVVETDTRQIKVGDGITKYKDLPYIEAKLVSSSYNNANNKVVYDYATNLFRLNKVPEKSQIIYELETGKVKKGDGKTKYRGLPYIDFATIRIEDRVGSDPVLKNSEIMVLHDTLGYTVKRGNGSTTFSRLPNIQLLAIDESTNTEYDFEYFADDSGKEIDGTKFSALIIVDTYDNFKKANPILLDGQIAICEQHSQENKIGNGRAAFDTLRTNSTVLVDSNNKEFESYDLLDNTGASVFSSNSGDSLYSKNSILYVGEQAVYIATSRISKIGDGKTKFLDLPKYEPDKVVYDYSTNLLRLNKVHEKTQVIYELETGKVKKGDGLSKYSELPYIDFATIHIEDRVGSDPIVKNTEIMVLHDMLGYTVRQGDGTTVFSKLPEMQLLAIDETRKEYEFEHFTNDSGEEIDGTTFNGLIMVDTYDNFRKANPILPANQIIICEQPSHGCKIGDGRTTFNTLRANSTALVDSTNKEFEFDDLLNENGASVISSNSGDLLLINNPKLNRDEQVLYITNTRISKIADGKTKFLDLPKYEPSAVADSKIVYYDTAVNFITNDPTLSKDTLGIESDTNKIKIGDGVNAWTALGYAKNM